MPSIEEILDNPFRLLIDPESVFQALQRSDRLERLQRRVFRPLDKPLIAKVDTDRQKFDKYFDSDSDADDSF